MIAVPGVVWLGYVEYIKFLAPLAALVSLEGGSTIDDGSIIESVETITIFITYQYSYIYHDIIHRAGTNV